MINSYDRRISSVLYEIDLCLTPGEVDLIREHNYTVEIWNVIQKHRKVIPNLPEVHKIKALTPVGCGYAIQTEDDIMLKQIILLTTVQDRRPATVLNAIPEEMLFLLHEAPRGKMERLRVHN